MTIAVVALIAEKKILLATDQDFEVSHEVSGEIATTKVSLNLKEDSCKRRGLDVLGGIHTEARETNADNVSQIGSNALTDVIALGVEISESRKPAIVKLERIGPRVERALTMEVSCDEGSVGVLEAWDKASVLRVLVDPVVGEVRRLAAHVTG